MKMLGLLLLLSVASAMADPITYTVTVDTSSITGTMGSLDFNFNPGPLMTQSASLQILGFSSDGTLAGSPTLTGDVSGTLPSTLTFDNGTGFNDYFEGFTFGSTLIFNVSLYGPAVSSPDGVSTSGSSFAFSMFSDLGGTMPVLTSDTTDGFAFTTGVNLDGSTTVNNSSSQTTVVPAQGVSGVPEPGSLALLEECTGMGRRAAFEAIHPIKWAIRSRASPASGAKRPQMSRLDPSLDPARFSCNFA